MSLDMFMKQNVKAQENEKIIVSPRMTDKDGNPGKWEIQSISNSKDADLRKKHTKQVKKAKGVYAPELDTSAFFKDIVVNCVVFPDLHNKDLQDSWGVMDAAELIDKLLLPGEYNELLEQIQKINGWDVELPDKVEEVKN